MTVMHRLTKHWFMVCLIIVLVVSYTAYVFSEPLPVIQPKVSFTYSRAAQTPTLAWPAYGESAIGVAGEGVLATHGNNAPLATASVAKILTALTVLKKAPLVLNESGPTITLTQADLDSYNKYLAENGSVVKVALGEQISEYQALEAMLLPSANNIAETLARWAFGTIDAYNSYATSLAQQLGMVNTTVTDPSGFLGTTTSTPHDLVILGEAALANPVISHIVALPSAIIPIQGTITNINVLLGYDGIAGIKTGNNDQDNGCFLFASHKTIGTQTLTIIGVIMNGPSLGTTMWDALPLINSTASSFTNVPIITAGTPVATYTTPWGDKSAIVAKTDLSIVAWKGARITSSVQYKNVYAPLAAGSQIGTLSASSSTSTTSYQTTLILNQTISEPNAVWRFTHSL
jgi:serine-type D-Ala-D-Ala carboxypeptidase (penicillin-binding protein 5/6)